MAALLTAHITVQILQRSREADIRGPPNRSRLISAFRTICSQLGRMLVEDEVHFLMACWVYAEERVFDVAACM